METKSNINGRQARSKRQAQNAKYIKETFSPLALHKKVLDEEKQKTQIEIPTGGRNRRKRNRNNTKQGKKKSDRQEKKSKDKTRTETHKEKTIYWKNACSSGGG